MKHVVQVEGPSLSEDDWVDVEVELKEINEGFAYEILGSWRWGEIEHPLNKSDFKYVEREIRREIIRSNKVPLVQMSVAA